MLVQDMSGGEVEAEATTVAVEGQVTAQGGMAMVVIRHSRVFSFSAFCDHLPLGINESSEL